MDTLSPRELLSALDAFTRAWDDYCGWLEYLLNADNQAKNKSLADESIKRCSVEIDKQAAVFAGEMRKRYPDNWNEPVRIQIGGKKINSSSDIPRELIEPEEIRRAKESKDARIKEAIDSNPDLVQQALMAYVAVYFVNTVGDEVKSQRRDRESQLYEYKKELLALAGIRNPSLEQFPGIEATALQPADVPSVSVADIGGGTAKGVTLMQVALILNDGENGPAQLTKKRWHNHKYRGLPKPIGKSTCRENEFVFAPSELCDFLENIGEPLRPNKAGFLKRLRKNSIPCLPI